MKKYKTWSVPYLLYDTFILSVSSIISSLSEAALKSLKTATYMVDTIEGKKYTSVLFKENGVSGFRFDLSCMVPVNNDAKYLHKELLALFKEMNVESIRWTGNKAVVIDNWNVLHGRRNISNTEQKRQLMRIYTG